MRRIGLVDQDHINRVVRQQERLTNSETDVRDLAVGLDLNTRYLALDQAGRSARLTHARGLAAAIFNLTIEMID
jgi:hypothetical protein